jgi:hypothetical protein
MELNSTMLKIEERSNAGILKLLRSPGIDSKESIPPAYVTTGAPAHGLVRQPGAATKRSIT